MVDQNGAYLFKERGVYYFSKRIPSDLKIYTHKVEKRLDRLGTYLVFIVIPLLLIIGMQLSALIIYLFSQN